MKLQCGECNNDQKFMATAKVSVEVLINGTGRVLDPRATDQILDDVEVVKASRCDACGSTNVLDVEGKDV